jgi:hypothetical protein
LGAADFGTSLLACALTIKQIAPETMMVVEIFGLLFVSLGLAAMISPAQERARRQQ